MNGDEIRSLASLIDNLLNRIGELEARCTCIENAGDALIDACESMREQIVLLETSTRNLNRKGERKC